MIEEFDDDFDYWEWFQADKDKVLRALQRKKISTQKPKQLRPHNRSNKVREVEDDGKISDRKLEEILNLQPLSMFLYLNTETQFDFFVDQIRPNDATHRVLIYSRILVVLCEIEMPGFHYDMLLKVASCTPLLEHYEAIVRKLCAKDFRKMWMDLHSVDDIICYMQTILLQAQRAGVMDSNAMNILFNIWMCLKDNPNPLIKERPVCGQFLHGLDGLFKVELDVLLEPNPAPDIYPQLEELQQWIEMPDDSCFQSSNLTISYKNNIEYINSQRLFLRHQFLLPLHELVRALHKNRSVKDLGTVQVAFEGVQIKLNNQAIDYSNTQNTKLLFVDILAEKRLSSAKSKIHLKTDERELLSKLKAGSLLCLTTSYDFNNLILATVVGLDEREQSRGYISIAIVRQYNIGNIYGKPYIMFETPVYCEPYERAYKYLTNSNVINFPMSDYIVCGLTTTQKPAYLNQMQPPNVYGSQKFAKKLENMPLNESQRSTLQHVLCTDFNLIQGPPGTGKTHLSLELVKTMLDHVKLCSPIVVITYTNDSLDKFLVKLSSHTNSIVRFGNQSRVPEIAKYNARADTNYHMVNPRLKRLYWMVKIEMREHFIRLQSLYDGFNNTDKAYAEILATQRQVWNAQEKLKSIKLIFQHYLISKKNVLAMTTTCAARMNFVFRFLKTQIVLFEEAAEILEAHILPCLTPYTKHVIMIGDHMQLKPHTSYVKGIGSSAASQSLFERLIRGGFHLNVLNVQYRMRSSFVDLLCPMVYEHLYSHESVDNFPPVRNMNTNLFFCDHRKQESKVRKGFPFNSSEAQYVFQLTRYLVELSGYTTSEIVILTPYSMQVEIIKRELSKASNLNGINVTTVDSFQGLEADIIVLSLVRSNSDGNIGFLSEQNRICVALSRARYGLYIVGNMKTLSYKSSFWFNMREILNKQNAIGGQFPYKLTLS